MRLVEELHAALDIGQSDLVHELVANALQRLDQSLEIKRTHYFTHTFVPDLVLRWTTPDGIRERHLHLRFSVTTPGFDEDLMTLGLDSPVFLGMTDRSGPSPDRRTQVLGADGTLVLRAEALDLFEQHASVNVVRAAAAAILRTGSGAIDEIRAERISQRLAEALHEPHATVSVAAWTRLRVAVEELDDLLDPAVRRELMRTFVAFGISDRERLGDLPERDSRGISRLRAPLSSRIESLPRHFTPVELTPLRIAVIGYGYWGSNLVRNVTDRPELELAGVCELDPQRAELFTARWPNSRVFADIEAVFADPLIDGAIVATPPSTHDTIARQALLAGKHVLVEKPLASSSENARELIELADDRKLVLMPGHTFVYSPPVNKIKQLIESGELGDIYFVTSSRMNLGRYTSDGVVVDLAPHDFSILLYILNDRITSVSAQSRAVFQSAVPETAFITLSFASGVSANVQVSWLSPQKVRQMTIVGSRRMIQYDDANEEAVRVFDRGMDISQTTSFGEYHLTYRSGDIITPRVEAAEPLSLELGDFAHAINTGSVPRSDARLGYDIVAALRPLWNRSEETVRAWRSPLPPTLFPGATGLQDKKLRKAYGRRTKQRGRLLEGDADACPRSRTATAPWSSSLPGVG